MAQPDPYQRQSDFTPLNTPEYTDAGARLNAELEAVAGVIGQVRGSLGAIQRDDGQLRNQSVHPEALSARVRSIIVGGWELRGFWQAGTAYQPKDVVAVGSVLYVALVAHTAAPAFATDQGAGRWLEWYEESTVPGDGVITPAMLSPAFSLPLAQLGTYTAPGPGAVARSVAGRFQETVYATDYGADPTGVADSANALEAAAARADVSRQMLVIPRGTYRIGRGIVFAAQNMLGIQQEGVIRYDGPGGEAALTIGTDNITAGLFNQSKVYRGLNVERAAQSNWLNDADVGIRLINIDRCNVEIIRAERFTIGLQLVGGLRGCEDSLLHLGRLIDNRIALDLRTTSASGWMNSLVFISGHLANRSATNPLLNRYGVRLSAAPGAYTLHNALRFIGVGFELQRQGTPGTVEAIPFLVEVDGRGLTSYGTRIEGCSPIVARHTAAMNDAFYEVLYIGTYSYIGGVIDYAPGATRAGGCVTVLPQALAAHHSPRLVAAAPHVRNRAFRWQRGSSAASPPADNGFAQEYGFLLDVGFDEMALAASSPSGSPTTMGTLLFPGLNRIVLAPDGVGLSTARALGFVLDFRFTLAQRGSLPMPKEIFIGAEGTFLRPVVMQFDGAENTLTDTSPVLFSNANALWRGAPSYWWETVADLDSFTGGFPLNQLQRVTLHVDCTYAFIGVRGSDPASELCSLRLFTGAYVLPRVLYGGTRPGAVRGWGQREFAGELDWTVPSLASGAVAQLSAAPASQIPVPNARQGDHVDISFAKTTGFQNGGVVFSGSVSDVGRVSVSAHNQSAGTIVVGQGVASARVTKRRL